MLQMHFALEALEMPARESLCGHLMPLLVASNVAIAEETRPRHYFVTVP